MTRPILYLFAMLAACVAEVPLNLSSLKESPGKLRFSDGIAEIQGPVQLIATPASAPPPGDLVVEFEFFCVGGTPPLSFYFGARSEEESDRVVPGIPHSETWSLYRTRVSSADNPVDPEWTQIRIEIPLAADRTLQIRNAIVRPLVPGEFARPPANPSASASEDILEAYLSMKPSGSLIKINVGAESIILEGRTSGPKELLALAEIPMERLHGDPTRFEATFPIQPGSDGAFRLTVPRKRQRNGGEYDRLLSRWQLIRIENGNAEQQSHARYADEIHCHQPDLPPASLSSKKGLGGWVANRIPGELTELGVTAVTVNMMVHSLISLEPGPDTTPIRWQGKTYHARNGAIANFDRTFLKARENNVMVSAILLIANPAKGGGPVMEVLGHPDAVPEGTYGMPNVTSTEGISLYGAIMNFMAERWSRADGKYGRVHHWIIQNEVDAGWVWTNVGEKPAVVYMDLYHRSMRLTDLIVRQHDPNSRPFISLTHHWAEAGNEKWYGSKRMLELLVRFCKAEGDFPWALAHHPYPQNLFNPRTWEDGQATFDFNTKKITPKNLEVLDAFMKTPSLLYRGEVRPVHLSENGFNSKDYSDKELEDQAAGMAYAWKKMDRLSSIEQWQYHNWVDNRSEGGLRIGLRKFPDEPGDPMGKKPIWHLYRALGTPDEDQVCEPYLKTIGIPSWNRIHHTRPIR